MVQDYHLFLVPADAARRCVRTCASGSSRTRRGCRRTTSRCCPTTSRYDDRRRHARRRRARLPHRSGGPTCSATRARAVCGARRRRRAGLPARHRRRRDAQRSATGAIVDSALRVLDDVVGDRLVIGRVDRTELSKNVWRGLLAYRELLRTLPGVARQGRARRLRQPVARGPARLPRVHRVARAARRARSTTSSAPTSGRRCMLEIDDDYPAALAVLRRSDVVFVNSVRDGMNLVVLEALVLSERDPAVVISRETGAAEMLGDDAITVNPFDVSASADALHDALLHARGRAGRARRPDARGRGDAAARAEWFQAQLDALRAVTTPSEHASRSHRVGGVGRPCASAASATSATSEDTHRDRVRGAARPRAVRADLARRRAGRRGRRRGTARPSGRRRAGAGRRPCRSRAGAARARRVRDATRSPSSSARALDRRDAAARVRRPDRRPFGRGRRGTAACPRSTRRGRRPVGEHRGQPLAAAPASAPGVSGVVSSPSVQVSIPYNPATTIPGTWSRPPRRTTVRASRPVITRDLGAASGAAAVSASIVAGDRTRGLRVGDERRERAVEVDGDEHVGQQRAQGGDHVGGVHPSILRRRGDARARRGLRGGCR